DIVAADGCGAAGGGEEAGDHFHGCGLARAVGAEEAEDFAALDGETHAVDGGEGSEALDELTDVDHGGRRAGVGHIALASLGWDVHDPGRAAAGFWCTGQRPWGLYFGLKWAGCKSPQR